MSAEYNPFVQRHTPDAEAVPDLEARSAGSSASPLFPATPVYARKRKSSNIGKVALFAVPAAILLAGAAVMLAQPRSSDLFAETTAVPPTLAPAAMPNPATEIADAAAASQPAPPVADQAPAAPPAPARRAIRRAAASPAPAPVADSPETWASDASARIPDAPIPYSPSAQAPVPAPVVTPPIAPSMTEPPAAPSVETPAQESPGEPTP